VILTEVSALVPLRLTGSLRPMKFKINRIRSTRAQSVNTGDIVLLPRTPMCAVQAYMRVL